jgi:uroporphyrinogen-III decarboxylase
MTDPQWESLMAILRGERLKPLPAGFIIDSPWLPGWAGQTILDYFTSERLWLDGNLKALSTFPEVMFLPGFWSEYGMCTEPSAFGAVSAFEENEFPFAKRILSSPEDVDRIETPDPRRNGLLPFVIKRLQHAKPEIERAGHKIRFAVARGPLNVASFLMGTTELMMALKTDPDRMHQLLTIVTDFLVEWINVQRELFPSIDGILALDDIFGFVGNEDLQEFGLPYLKRVFSVDVKVKFFHNDAPAKVCAPFLASAGVNLFNFGIQHTLSEMRSWVGEGVTLLGNLPPRDVLASAAPDAVRKATREMLTAAGDTRWLLPSCGGGMPPGVSSENVRAFVAGVRDASA